jgi:hypothetical protein
VDRIKWQVGRACSALIRLWIGSSGMLGGQVLKSDVLGKSVYGSGDGLVGGNQDVDMSKCLVGRACSALIRLWIGSSGKLGGHVVH